jgi:fatty-acyl-CoA synthase
MFDLDLLDERARVSPDKLELVSVETGERLTYAQLNERVWRAAGALHAAGLEKGDRFGILSHNSVDSVALFFASGRVGTIVVPMSTRATSYELDQIANDCSMRAFFRSDDFSAMELAIPALPLKESVEAAEPARVMSPIDPEDVYCLLYTSGTTGKPKGVMIPRRQLYWNGYNTAICWDLSSDDIAPVFTPIYHAGGLAVFMIPLFCVGGTVVLHKGFDTTEVWRTISAERCTVVLGVPTIWKMLLESPHFADVDLSHVRWFISGGAPLPQYLIEAYRRRGVSLKQGYGMTEVGVNCFTMTVEEAARKSGSIGRPMMFTSVRIVDADGSDALPGEIGEMWIRGPHVSLGYWNNRAATEQSYTRDGWFRTGDLVRRDEEGFFYIAGRSKEMFISGGVNVYPAEIEAELVAHPGVSDAAVLAIPDETWGEVAVAFVVGSEISAEQLNDYLASRLSKYKLPKRFIFVDALPRTPYGKVVKQELREKL